VRHRLGFQLFSEIKRPDGTLPLLQLAPEWEEKFATYQVEGERGQSDVALPPSDFNKLAKSMADKIAKASETGIYPAIITSTRRRRFLKTVLAAQGIQNPVFSFEEIGTEAKPSLVGLVPA
jgi:flagellar biosynthesis protein FlhA